jgi:predicted transposase/invertase (TIGR01784 family)
MAKQKRPRLDFDPKSEFLTNPHDKYAKFILKIKAVAEGIVRNYLPAQAAASINFDTFELASDSFIDEHLREHLSDICYTARTTAGDEMRITILIEHKSTAYQGSVLFQLNRYIGNIHLEYEKQGHPLPMVVPILLYHGETPIKYETPQGLFPNAPSWLLEYVPTFRYILINVQQMDKAEIAAIEDILLQKFFLVLKNSRNERFLATYWIETFIFADENRLDVVLFNQVTMIYLSATSTIYRKKLDNMDTGLPQEEAVAIKSYLFDLYDEGMEKGIAKGMEKGMKKLLAAFIRNNPSATDADIAKSHDVPVAWVKKIREQLKKSGK